MARLHILGATWLTAAILFCTMQVLLADCKQQAAIC